MLKAAACGSAQRRRALNHAADSHLRRGAEAARVTLRKSAISPASFGRTASPPCGGRLRRLHPHGLDVDRARDRGCDSEHQDVTSGMRLSMINARRAFVPAFVPMIRTSDQAEQDPADDRSSRVRPARRDCTAAGADAQGAVDELLAADRQFSAAGAKLDAIASISAMFADDVVIMPVPPDGFARRDPRAGRHRSAHRSGVRRAEH